MMHSGEISPNCIVFPPCNYLIKEWIVLTRWSPQSLQSLQIWSSSFIRLQGKKQPPYFHSWARCVGFLQSACSPHSPSVCHRNPLSSPGLSGVTLLPPAGSVRVGSTALKSPIIWDNFVCNQRIHCTCMKRRSRAGKKTHTSNTTYGYHQSQKTYWCCL